MHKKNGVFTIRLTTEQASDLAAWLGATRIADLPAQYGRFLWSLFHAIHTQLVADNDVVDLSGAKL